MNKRPKIYYTGGLLSLLLIPLLCYCFIEKQLNQRNSQRCIELITCQKDTSSLYCFRCIPPKRNYQDIKLNGNETEDHRKLLSIDSITKSYYDHDDSISGLHIVFGNSSSYGSFVKVINICQWQKMPYFMIDGNQIWIFYNFVNLEMDGHTCKAKYLGKHHYLIQGEYVDFEVERKLQYHQSRSSCIVDFEEDLKIKAEEERQKNLWKYVHEKRVSLGILSILYILMFILSIRKALKR